MSSGCHSSGKRVNLTACTSTPDSWPAGPTEQGKCETTHCTSALCLVKDFQGPLHKGQAWIWLLGSSTPPPDPQFWDKGEFRCTLPEHLRLFRDIQIRQLCVQGVLSVEQCQGTICSPGLSRELPGPLLLHWSGFRRLREHPVLRIAWTIDPVLKCSLPEWMTSRHLPRGGIRPWSGTIRATIHNSKAAKSRTLCRSSLDQGAEACFKSWRFRLIVACS